MGQLVLLVVAAAWAAVLLPPLLRSRLENRPNSSVLDFRNQLSSLQRAVPTRGVGVRSMGRSLAPSMLTRPAATGRPDTRNGARLTGVVSSRMAPTRRRPVRRGVTPGCRRPRCDPASTAPRAIPVSPPPLANTRAAEAKRRRANVLFLLVLTTVCAGFLAATTDSKAMVYLFAVSMVALGGYVYLLVTINQQQFGGRDDVRERPATSRRRTASRRYADDLDNADDRRVLGRSASPTCPGSRPAGPPSTRPRSTAIRPAAGVGPHLLRVGGDERAAHVVTRASPTAARRTAGIRRRGRRRAGRRYATAATPPARSPCSGRAARRPSITTTHAG